MSDLATVDLHDVEILAADVMIHGRGSPPEGDRYSTADLAAIADANRELADELQPPAKIGHDGNGPAVGHVTNIRVAGDKLLADVKSVPRKFADLVRARAFNGRSVELGRVTSQRTGKKYDFVVTGLAWLGDKLPAVRTLDDVAALYDADVELARAYELDTRTGDARIDEAIGDGRIAYGQRDIWARTFELAPELAAEQLAALRPNESRASANFGAANPALVELHEREMAADLGVKREELI